MTNREEIEKYIEVHKNELLSLEKRTATRYFEMFIEIPEDRVYLKSKLDALYGS